MLVLFISVVATVFVLGVLEAFSVSSDVVDSFVDIVVDILFVDKSYFSFFMLFGIFLKAITSQVCFPKKLNFQVKISSRVAVFG